MATFKVCVRKQRKDGFWPVYVRVIHHTKVGYIITDKIVSNDGIDAKGEVKDPFVLNFCTNKIVRWVDMLNRVNCELLTTKDILEMIRNEDSEVCFSDYARSYHWKMIEAGQVRNARNYELAYQHLERFAGTTRLMFNQLTTDFVNRWIASMANTHRAKEMYPICIRQIFKAALRDLNDYDAGVLKIKTNPWLKVEIPRADKTEQLAISPQACRDFFSAPVPESKFKSPLPELGRDVAMMVLCLAGMNTVDIYGLQKKDYYDGILHYHRAKTKGSRRDAAYMEMRVPSILMPLFGKYAARPDDPFLFCFHERHSTSDSFGANVNIGIRKICESMGMVKEDRYCVYTFRHTWATLAQNNCGASLADVALGLNHSSGHTVTRGYVKMDYSPAWELNEKVIDLVFFSADEQEVEKEEDVFSFERFSPKYMMRGTVYFKGRELGSIQDIGFHNVEEIIAKLVKFVPDDVPQRCNVQFKIENCDKKQTAIYERMKGKGF